jgi:AcrR family transcriptional regulator
MQASRDRPNTEYDSGMRRKNQTSRRRQLAEAGRQVLLERGAVGLRVKDIAERAGIAPSSVLYYYPRMDELMMDVSREAIERYAERRSQQVRRLDDPARQLRLAIHLGVPTGPDDDDSRLLYELDAFTGTSRAFAVMSSSFFDRQAMLYEHVLESGAAQGTFTLAAPAGTIARSVVALEDGLGLQVVIGHPGLDSDEAERILLRYAGLATGTDLEQVPLQST